MKNNSNNVFASAILMCVALVLTSSGFSQSGLIKFTTENVELTEGDTLSTEIIMNTGSSPISVFDVHAVFDPEYIEILSINNVQGTLFQFHEPPTFSNAQGSIDMAGFQIDKTLPVGDISLVEITFVALNPTNLTTIYHPMSVFPKTLMAYAGDNMLEQADDLKITILESDVLSNDSPIENDAFALDIWPNPSDQFAFINFNLNESKQVELDIYDVHGKLVMRVYSGMVEQNKDYRFQIDLSNLASGSYVCRLTTDKHMKSKQIVVAK